jgi:hypothetical protein
MIQTKARISGPGLIFFLHKAHTAIDDSNNAQIAK